MHERKIYVRYLIEFFGTLALYALVLVVSIDVGRPMPKGIVQTLILVSPMVPTLLMIAVVVRQIRRADEYMRLQTLENIAIAAGVTAGWTFTYGFLENAGFPHLSMFNVMPNMFFIWAVLAIVRSIAGR